MSDSTNDDQTAEPGGDAPRRPNPGAQAASRARRIGGRPMPGPRPAGEESPETESSTLARGSRRSTATAAPPTSAAQPPTRSRTAKPPKQPKARSVPDATTYQRRLATAGLVLVIISSVAVAAVLGIGLWLSHGVWWAKSSTDAHRNAERQQVLAAAKTCTARILSYDYRTLAASEKAGQACATGQLRSDYTKLMDTTVKQIAPQSNVVQVFQVEKAGVSSVSPDGKQWVIVVYGQQQVSSKTITSGPRLDVSNAVVTLNKVGGQWLVSNMTTTS